MIPKQDIDVASPLLRNVDDLYRQRLDILPEVYVDGERTLITKELYLPDVIPNSLNSEISVEPRPKLVHVSPTNTEEVSHSNATKNAKEADIVRSGFEVDNTDRSHSDALTHGKHKPVNYASDAKIEPSAQVSTTKDKTANTRRFFKRRGSTKSGKRRSSSSRRSSMCNDNSKTRTRISVGSKLKAKFFSSAEKGNAAKDLLTQGSHGESSPRSTPDSAKSPVIKNINKVVRFPRVSRSYSLDTSRTSAHTRKKEVLQSFTEDGSSAVADQNTPSNRQTESLDREGKQDVDDASSAHAGPHSPRKASVGIGKNSDYDLFATAISLSPRRPLQKLKSHSTHGLQNEAQKDHNESWDRTQSQHSLFQSNQSLTHSNRSLIQSTQSLAFSNQSLATARKEKRVTQKGSEGVISMTRHESLKRHRHSTYPQNADRRKVSGGSLKLISSTGTVLKNTGTAKSVEVLSSHKGRQLKKTKSITKLDLEKLKEEEKERKRNQREEERRLKEIQNKRKQQQRLEIYALNKIMTEVENSNFERFMESKSNVSSLPV